VLQQASQFASSGDLAVEAVDLVKEFGDTRAVDGVSLAVPKGSIYGLLGPNGAGKTTTLKMLTTLLEPTGGSATVAGSDLRRDPVGVRRRIGYVSQAGSTSPEALVGEELVDHARLYDIPPAISKARARDLLAALDLADIWDRKCGSLSGGQRRRLDIVMGLIHQPELVFLDEPSTGLDPQSRANLWTHIRKLRDELGTSLRRYRLWVRLIHAGTAIAGG